MSERLDIAIIGSGPAGISAAVNAKIRNKKFMIFGSKEISNKLTKAHEINNYLGFFGKSGVEIKDAFQKHLESMEIEITEEKVNNIYSMGDYFALLVNDKVYEATSIILATGINFGKPLKGEEEFLGKGVSYCATCDAPLYRDREVIVIAYSKEEEHEVDFLASVASKVYLVPMYKEAIEVDERVEIIRDIPLEILGDKTVEKLRLKNQDLEAAGIFILRDSISPGQLIPGLKMDENHVEVDRKMTTNLQGCFAAGDIVGTPYQYIKSAGEGNIAALSAVSYVDHFNKKAKEKENNNG
jgi:thioredoxin reductase (NADPH)